MQLVWSSLHSPSKPSFLTTCLTTSMGPANVLDLSWSLIPQSATPRHNTIIYALDLDKLERHDHEALGRTSRAASSNGEILRHLLLASERHEALPPKVVGRAKSTVNTVFARLQARGTCTHNFVARFGASMSSGGRRPRYKRPKLWRRRQYVASR